MTASDVFKEIYAGLTRDAEGLEEGGAAPPDPSMDRPTFPAGTASYRNPAFRPHLSCLCLLPFHGGSRLLDDRLETEAGLDEDWAPPAPASVFVDNADDDDDVPHPLPRLISQLEFEWALSGR